MKFSTAEGIRDVVATTVEKHRKDSANAVTEDEPMHMPVNRFARFTRDLPERYRRKARVLFAGNPLPMWIYDVESLRFLEVNESAENQYGYTRAEFLTLTLNDILPVQHIEVAQELIHSGDSDRACVHLKKDGTPIHVTLRTNEVRFRGRHGRYVVAENITERLQLHARLLKLAHHDALTGLPNRLALEQRMKQSLNAATERSHRSAIICLDLDRFKHVNDRYGHAVGDECLKRAGSMLVRRLRGMDTVARTGGEEFTIVLAEVESVAAAGMVAKALLQVFSLPVRIAEHEILLGASLGVAVFPDHGTDGPELWRRADVAMYRAKRAGGNRHVMLGANITSALAETVDIETHMHSTLEKRLFRLDYQPHYSMDRQICGLEALLRVPDLNLDPISPDRFIPMAEENGFIHPLGKWVLEEACRRLMALNSLRPKPISITINLSPLQLMHPDFPREVQEVVARFGINPAWLEMEISERTALNFEAILTPMTQLAAMGIRFTLDDFGTGYSSLQHLLQLPISTLKMDRAFIQQLSDSSRSYSIVKAVISMGHSLNMQVIAKGIENEDQITVLRELGCDGMQGFLLSRPLSPGALEALLLAEG